MSDDKIIIRDFVAEDLDRFRTLFRNGMMLHAPTLTNLLTRHRLTCPSLVHPLVTSIPFLVLAPPRARKDSLMSAFVAYIASAMFSALGWWAYYYYYLSPKLFKEYIQNSLDDDIANIPRVYQKNEWLLSCCYEQRYGYGCWNGRWRIKSKGIQG